MTRSMPSLEGRIFNDATTDLEFRYSHVTQDGETASGHCTSTIRMHLDPRLLAAVERRERLLVVG